MHVLYRLATLILAALVSALPALAEPVPFRLIKDKVVVPVTINGHATFAVVDTAAQTCIDIELARELDIAAGRPTETRGLNGGAVAGSIASGVEVGLSGATSKMEVLVAKVSFSKHLKTEAPVLIGHDLLKQHVVSIDFDALVFDIAPAAGFTAFPKTKPVALKPYGNNWSLPIEIEGFGQNEALFDLGAEGAMIVAPTALERLRLTFGKKTSAALLYSVDGQPMEVTMMSLSGISLGGAAFDNVPVATLRRRSKTFQAIVGTALLSRFNLVIDLSRARLWMTPNRRIAMAFRRGVTGLVYGEDMVLEMVAPGSPAKAAGFKAGERIAALYDAAGALILDTHTIVAGDAVRVVLADGREKTIVAAAYY